MSETKPRISIVTPVHDMPNGDFFLNRLKGSLLKQTFKDYELIITKNGFMAENSNSAIQQASGDIVKILYLDDYLYDENALQHLVEAFEGGAKWAVSGCVHDNGHTIYNQHTPVWSKKVRTGENTIGSPSVLAFVNDDPLLFDERLSWLLDCELYGRLYDRYGEPTIISSFDVGIGIHDGQTTNTMSDEAKAHEHTLI